MNKTAIGILGAIVIIGGGWLIMRNGGDDEAAEVKAPANQTPVTAQVDYTGAEAPAGAVQTTAAVTPNHDNIYLSKTDSVKGSYMTDFAGNTLYIFDKDTTGVSNCSGGCLSAWPAYTSGATAQGSFPENISVITRTDGSKQFAWKGMPLYYYAKDKKAGDITGDGVGGIWHIVKQ